MQKDTIIVTLVLFILVFCGLSYGFAIRSSRLQAELESVQASIEQVPKAQVNDYKVVITGDTYFAQKTNAEVDLRGGEPSLNKGLKVSVPAIYNFRGTDLRFTLKFDKENPHYILAKFYRNNKLILEQDSETPFRDISLIDLNTGRQ